MNKIIVCDDSKIIQNIISKFLSDEYEILIASNGKEVIKYITDKVENIECILLDLNMPDYDGFHVLNYFKNNNLFDKYPVFIISGDDSKETIDKAFEYKIVDMLNKPFTKENIKNTINKIKNIKTV